MINRSLAIFTFVVIVALVTSSFAQNPPAATTPQTPPGTRRTANTGGQTSTAPPSRKQQDIAPQSEATPSGSQPSAPPPVSSGSRERRVETAGTAAPGETSRARSISAAAVAAAPGLRGVRAAFDVLITGIRRSDVDVVMSGYWNSPQLLVFNHNGTVTKTWDQVRSNRASYYPNAKNVELEVRNVDAQMLGRDGAFVTCLWRQSQTFSGQPESASGRLTVVFRRIGGAWKAVHAHTSPDAPERSRVPPSERSESPSSTKRMTPSSPTNEPPTS